MGVGCAPLFVVAGLDVIQIATKLYQAYHIQLRQSLRLAT